MEDAGVPETSTTLGDLLREQQLSQGSCHAACGHAYFHAPHSDGIHLQHQGRAKAEDPVAIHKESYMNQVWHCLSMTTTMTSLPPSPF
jgi:hypothetical protein